MGLLVSSAMGAPSRPAMAVVAAMVVSAVRIGVAAHDGDVAGAIEPGVTNGLLWLLRSTEGEEDEGGGGKKGTCASSPDETVCLSFAFTVQLATSVRPHSVAEAPADTASAALKHGALLFVTNSQEATALSISACVWSCSLVTFFVERRKNETNSVLNKEENPPTREESACCRWESEKLK